MQFYSDFPKPGVDFVDVSPVFQDVEARKQCLGALTDKARNAHADLIVAVESRGFIYGAPIADRLDLPLVIVRKPGKLPGPIFTQEVKTEYSETKLQMQKDAIPTGSRVIIVDDVLATGGSVTAARALVEQAGGVVVQYLFHVVLDKFESEQRANGIPAALVEKLVLRSAALLPPPPLPSFVPFVSGVVGIGYGQNQPWVKNRVLILYHPAMKRLAESLAGREPWRFELAPPIQWNSFDDSWPNIKFPAILHGRKVLFLFSMSSMSSFAPQASLAMVLPRQGVKSLHIVIPYFAPGTMEKITEPGVLATADTFARMLSADMPSTPSGPPCRVHIRHSQWHDSFLFPRRHPTATLLHGPDGSGEVSRRNTRPDRGRLLPRRRFQEAFPSRDSERSRPNRLRQDSDWRQTRCQDLGDGQTGREI